jgi:hypothetical protein
MKRKFKILGLSMVVAAILALAIAGTVVAAGNNPDIGSKTQNQGAECLCGKCPCGECVCGDSDPINHEYNHDYSYSYSYSYSSPGPNGFQKGK